MRIKIPANIKNELTKNGLQKTIEKAITISSNTNNELKTNLIMISEFEDGKRIVNQAINIQSNDLNFISVLANPTHLFLKNAIDSFLISQNIEKDKFPNCGQTNGGNIFFLKNEVGYTHDCFNDFLSNRISCIILLVCSIENFINQLIPPDFTCSVDNQGKIKKFKNAIEIERSASFKNKIEQIVPKIINPTKDDFWENKLDILDVLIELNKHRNNFIHLKTNSEEEWKRFSTVFSDMVEFNLKHAIECVIEFFNYVKPNYIEIEKE